MARLVLYLTFIILFIGSAMARCELQFCPTGSQNFVGYCMKFLERFTGEPSGRCYNNFNRDSTNLQNQRELHGSFVDALKKCLQLNIPDIASHINHLSKKCCVRYSFHIFINVNCIAPK